MSSVPETVSPFYNSPCLDRVMERGKTSGGQSELRSSTKSDLRSCEKCKTDTIWLRLFLAILKIFFPNPKKAMNVKSSVTLQTNLRLLMSLPDSIKW